MAIRYLSNLTIDGGVTTASSSTMAGATFTSGLAMSTNKITGLGDPTLAQDAATKNYVDSISVGVTEVDANSTKNGLTLTTSPATGIISTGSVVLGGTLAINNSDWSGNDLAVINGGTGASSAGAALINLGGSNVGINLFELTDPAAIRFIRINANNSVDALSAADFRTAIGAGTGGGSMSTWKLAADSGSDATITDGDTVTVNGTGVTSTLNSGPTLSLVMDIKDLTDAGSIATGDYIAFSDEGETGDPTRRALVSELLALVSQPTVNNSTITLTAGAGLTGSSSFTLNQASNQTITLSLDISSLTTSTTASDADWFAVSTTMGSDYKIAPGNINLSTFNNDSGWTSNAGTVTSVGYTHGGNAFTVGGSPVTSSGTLAVTMAGSSSQYIDGAGNLTTFPTIPQGDVTGVSASTNDNYLGITVANSTGPVPEVGINIQGLTALSATPADEDELIIYDEGAPKNKKITVQNLMAAAPQGDITAVVAGTGMSGGGTSGSVTLNCSITNNNQLTNGAGYTTFAEPGIFSGGGTPTLASGVTAAEIRSLIGAGTGSGSVTSVATGAGLTGGTITGSGTVAIDYAGSDNLVLAATEATIGNSSSIIYNQSNNAYRALLSDIGLSKFDNDSGFTTNSGTVTSVTVSAGSGLGGGGTVTTSGTITLTADVTASSSTTFTNKSGNISQWTNDSGYTTNAGDITAVTAGSGLTGGGTSGSVTLNVGAGALIDVAADSVAVDLSELTDMTQAWDNATDEFVVLDNSSQKRKLSSEIFGSNAFNSTTIPTNNNQLTNGAGYVTSSGVTSVATGNSNTLSKSGTTSVTLTPNTGAVSGSSSNLATGAQIQTAINAAIATIPSGLAFEGNWNANTDNPDLSGLSPDNGQFWIVSVAGSTDLDGITDWKVGDWAIYVDNGAGTDGWQKVDNTSILSGSGASGRMTFWNSSAALSSDADLTYNSGTNVLTVGGGTSTEWDSAYDNMITGFSDSGTSTVTLTLTQQDGGTLTTSFAVPQGDITGVTAGSGLSGGGTSGTVTLTADVTASSTTTFTNKSGAISQWTNDSGYTTNAGDITGVTAGNKLTGGGTSGTLTLGLASDNISQCTNDSGYTTNAGDITAVTAGTGLSGGGTSGGVTLALDVHDATTTTTANLADWFAVASDEGDTYKIYHDNIGLSRFNNDAGFVNTSGIISLTAGVGLSGGGSSSAESIALDLDELSTTTTSSNAKYFPIVDTSGNQYKIAPGDIDLSSMNNDSGWTSSAGDITAVTAGTGLSGGGTSGGVTLNVSMLGLQDLSDPNDDRIFFWDDTQGAAKWLDIGTNLSISGTTLNATDTDSNSYINSASFNTGNGVLTLSGVGSAGATVDLDGRYVTSSGVTSIGITAGTGISVSGSPVTGSGSITVTNTITNNNQLTNGAGYTTNTGTTTASNTQTFTNKSGNISQWTNDSGYTTNSGDITGVTAGTGMSGGGTSGTVTLNCTITNNNQLTNGAGYTTNTGDITNVSAGDYLTGGGASGSVTLNVSTSSSGDRWGHALVIGSDGVMEAGKYMDWHDADGDTSDYDVRMTCSGSQMQFSGDIYASSTINSNADLRAPILYDSANTSYYFDGSSTGDSIRVAGDIVAYFSDERLKDIQGNIPDALNKVKQLNGFYYTANEKAQEYGYEADKKVGLSAQEVESVLPEIIKEAPIGDGYKTVDYAKVVPLLVEAIKDLSKELEEVKKQLKHN